MKNRIRTVLIFLILILSNNNIISAVSPLHQNVNLKNLSEENALEILRTSKSHHILKDFNSATKGYNTILNSSCSRSIKSEALVYKMLAKAEKPVSIKYEYHPNFLEIADKSRVDYKEKKYSVISRNCYSPFDSYFDYELNTYRESDDLSFDNNKIPMIKYNGKFYYNPITVEQYALSLYGKYLNGGDTKKLFLDCADFLLSYMDERGAFKYDFVYNHYEDLPPGWTSSMAQGQALSVFGRAFNITGNRKYIDGGNKALKYLITPVSEGGVMDTLKALDINLKDKIFFQEYVNTTSSYTLNGYIFTLIGLYDWSQVEKLGNNYYCIVASEYFNKGVESLKCILPYYDIGGFTNYDLYFITKKTNPNSAGYYHSVHIEQLDAIYYLTKDPYFKDIRDLWNSYVKA